MSQTPDAPHAIDRKKYFFFYSAAWLAGALFIYSFFRSNGRDMLWVLDGVYQHFPTFNYVCEISESVFHGGSGVSGSIPFNYTLGQGSDIFTTLNSYDFADPVSWICSLLFFMTRVHRYTVMVFIKLWLCGAAFSDYAFVTGNRNSSAVLCGALAYTFSGNILYMFAMHPNFINWAYFLPLILGGYELYRNRRIKSLLILSVFFNLLTSFYTFYINTMLLVLYVVVRSLANWSVNRTAQVFKDELMTDLRAAGICLEGALLCCFSLLPTLNAYRNNPRVAESVGYDGSMLHYDSNFYRDAFTAFFSSNFQINYKTVLGVFCIVLPAIICFYISSGGDCAGRRRALKLYGVIVTAMMCIPMAGKILNGMSYACNRFVYVIVFTASVMLTESFEDLSKCKAAKRAAVTLAGLAYVLAYRHMDDSLKDSFKSAFLIMLLTAVAVCALGGFIGKRFTAAALTAVTVLCMFFHIYYIFSPETANYISQFEKTKNHNYNNSDSSIPLSGLSTEDDFFRVESQEHTTNVDGINNVNSTGAWWSMYPGSMLDYLNAFESNMIIQNCCFEGLGNRTALLELAAVRYYTAPASPSNMVPYGYELSEALSTDDYNIYENTLALPVGYTFENYISRARFDALGPLDKQEALLQGVVLDQESCAALPGEIEKTEPVSSAYELEYEISGSENAALTEDTMTADCGGAFITMYADIPENSEIYLQIEGVKMLYPDNGNIDCIRISKNPKRRASRTGRISNLKNCWPVIRDGITYDLGIGVSGRNEIRICFTKKSGFNYDSIKLWAVPMDSYKSRVGELGKCTLMNAKVTGREISGTAVLPRTGIMQIAVPYSTGWSAFIDGKKTEVMNSDILYMAVVVPKGSHEIVLRYRTPYLLEGAVVSAITLLAMAAAFIRPKKRASG